MIRYLSLTLFFLFFNCFASRDVFSTQRLCSIDVVLSSSEIRFEEELTVFLILSFPVGYYPDFEALRRCFFTEDSLQESPFTLLEEKHSSCKESDGWFEQKIDYILEVNFPGKHLFSFPSIPFYSKERGKKVMTAFSNVQTLVVHCSDDLEGSLALSPFSILPLDNLPQVSLSNQNHLYLLENNEEKKNEALFLRSRNAFIAAVVIIGSCFLGGLFRYLFCVGYFRKKRIVKNEPHFKALRTLCLLKEKKYLKKGLFSLYYMELTEIVRIYIEEKYSLKVSEKTTEEFLQDRETQSLFEEIAQNLLGNFLSFADLVKFARVHPSIQDCHQMFKAAKKFIVKTQ